MGAQVDEALDMVLVEMAEACVAGDLRATATAVRKAHERLFAAVATAERRLRRLAEGCRTRNVDKEWPALKALIDQALTK